MKTNHSMLKVTLMVFAVFGLAAGIGQSVAFTNTSSGRLLDRTTPLLSPTTKNTINPNDFEEVSSAKLAPKIVSYTGTSLSRRLGVQFESQAISAFAPRSKDVFYVINDPRYSGKNTDPFSEEVPDKTLNGFTYSAVASSTQTSLYISNSISYGSYFTIKNAKIVAGAMYRTLEIDPITQQEVATYDAYKYLTTIYICEGVEEVESGAFTNVPSTVTFKCLASSKPVGWADDWTDAPASQIEWGAEIDNAAQKAVKHAGSTTSFGDAEDFILGYKGNSDIGFGAYPLTISYEKILKDGTRKTEYQELPTKHQTNPYDAVGSKIYGKTNSFEVTINFNKGESVDETSFEFYNIFKAQRLYIEEKEPWPVEKINDVFDLYEVPTAIEGLDGGFVPSLDGNSFFYQTFETEADKYLTIAREFDTEEEANALLNSFKEKITSFKVDKDVFQTENDLAYAPLENYTAEKYGDVYGLLFTQQSGEKLIRVNIFIQTYVVHNDNIGKYEFVTYLVLDRPVEEVDSDGNPTGNLVNSSRVPFPIAAKDVAVRPFVYVPEYNSEGNVKTPKQSLKAHGVARFNKMIDVNELISTKYQSASKFLNYTSVGMTADKVLGTAYAGYLRGDDGKFNKEGALSALTKGADGKYYHGSDVFNAEDVEVVKSFKAPLLYINDNSSRAKVETNLNSILDGKINFRYTITNLNTASLVVSYKQGNEVKTTELPIKSPSPVIEMNKDTDNVISFLVNNALLDKVNTQNIVAVGISGVTINIHLYNSESHNVVQNTQYLNVFGNIEVLPEISKDLTFFNINLYLFLFFGILTLGYAAAAVVLFFYRKNKYKNDEFRRMRPKAYIKSAVLGYVGLVLITAAINFIFLRFGVFNSTVPTYNPIDAFVIAFSIFGAIALGLFIRSAAIAFKLAKKRRETKRLKLDKDVADDGTK